MMTFLIHLLIASLVGTILWMTQNIIKQVTEKLFSQTWHYYTALIPVCFLLGGSEICIRLFSFIRFFLQQPNPALGVEKLGEAPVSGAVAGGTGKGSLLMEQLLDQSLRFAFFHEILIGLVLTWAIGLAVFLGSHIHAYLSYKRSLLQGSRVYRNGIFPVQVRISPRATTPLLIGIWKPILILPEVELGEHELVMILSHERVHFKRGDLPIKFLVLAANAVHWFNPAIYRLAKQITARCELSCDEQVVRGMDAESRRRYGEILLSMLEYSVKQRDIAFTTPLCSSKTEIKRRLVNLMKEKKSKKSALLLSLLSAFVWVGGGGAAAYAAGASLPSDLSPRKQTLAATIPTGKQTEGRNIYVQSPDGTVIHYDKEGNTTTLTLEEAKKLRTVKTFDEKTQKKIDALREEIQLYLKQNLAVPTDTIADYTPDEIQAALNGVSGYVYDGQQNIRPIEFGKR